jgi:hypothetical protein
MAITKTVAYLAENFDTLKDLESSCKRDEGKLGKLIKIELAAMESADGKKAVAITYEKVTLPTDINIGRLNFIEFSDNADANLKSTERKAAGDTPVLPGDEPRTKVYIGNKTVNILVFRDKA